MVDETIYEPKKLYESGLKHEFHENALKYFDDLIKKAKTDESLNKETVKKYNKAAKEAEEMRGKLTGMRVLKTVLAILAAVFFAVALGGLLFCFQENANLAITISMAAGGIVLGVVLVVIICLPINKEIKRRKNLHEELAKKTADLLATCYAQTAGLCKLFDWNIPQKLVKMTTPIIQLDDYFDSAKFDLLATKYGFGTITDQNISTELVLSGSVVGNPFLIVKNIAQDMGTKAYQGTLTISWTERYTDSDGHTSYRTRTQTLVATVNKPCPVYNHQTYLVYGNDAAPKLCFSRKKSGLMHPDEKEVNRFVRRREDDLQRAADKAVKENRKFTPMNNIDFEILWGGWNRNNEVEYRLLFTALAQQNEIDLITDKNNFGDDFYFEKRHNLNFVCSDHSQRMDYYANPFRFSHYDVDTIRNSFVNYMDSYFQSLYFDLAPVLSIPLYQQQKPLEYIYKDSYPTNFSQYENESMANAMDETNFRHPRSVTPSILKVTKVEKRGHTDKVLITAHSFYTEPRVDYVPVMGGDGYMHDVPVQWEEYLPLQNQRWLATKAYRTTRQGYEESLDRLQKEYFHDSVNTNGMRFERGLLGFLINEAYGEQDDSALEKAFGYNIDNKED